MAMTAASMWTRVKANIAGVTASQGSDPVAAAAYRDQVGIAMCQGIIDEIKTAAVVQVTSVQPGTGTVNGTVTA